MKRFRFVILTLLIFLGACRKNDEVLVPDTNWSLFNSAQTASLNNQTRVSMEGVYSISDGDGANMFGPLAVLKWSYEAEGTDTTYYLSAFCGKDITYFIMEGKKLNDSLLFNGYWRKMANTETGIVRFMISPSNGASQLLSPMPEIGADSIIMTGYFGEGQESPGMLIVLKYLRPLYQGPAPFEILAHRCGGQNSDLLPASENSVGMIKLASQLGATGAEMDVQLTSDSVPVIYHDNTLDLRVVQKSGLAGPIENYSYGQLYTLVRLTDGERIPTLREALDAVLYNTNLRYVWLDIKFSSSLLQVRNLQNEYLQKAVAAGRSLQILIGIAGEDQLNSLMALPDYDSIPSLCELTTGDVQKINARVWAPTWTQGLQPSSVALMKSEGRKSFVWTVDVPDFIEQFINQGNFDGLLSNYSPLVAYDYYVKQ